MIVTTSSVRNASPNDHQPITGLIVPVEPHSHYLLEYVLKVAAEPGCTGIRTLADGPVGTEVAVQDGVEFTGSTDAAMLVTLVGLAETHDAGGHVLLYFASLGAPATVVAGSIVRATKA